MTTMTAQRSPNSPLGPAPFSSKVQMCFIGRVSAKYNLGHYLIALL
jgi:hypothetical protein